MCLNFISSLNAYSMISNMSMYRGFCRLSYLAMFQDGVGHPKPVARPRDTLTRNPETSFMKCPPPVAPTAQALKGSTLLSPKDVEPCNPKPQTLNQPKP